MQKLLPAKGINLSLAKILFMIHIYPNQKSFAVALISKFRRTQKPLSLNFNLGLSLSLLFILSFNLSAQDLPLKITVPPVCIDPNQQFNVINFDSPDKDQFSILYSHFIYGSVMRADEYVQDTGSVVFKDKRKTEAIYNSNQLLLIKKQRLNASGQIIFEEQWLLATRKLDSEGEFKLYFQKGYKHPMVQNRTPITLSIYNINQMQGLSNDEMAALVNLTSNMIPREIDNSSNASNPSREPTIADDIKSMKKQIKALREAGMMFKGDLPSNEKVLTRYPMAPERTFVITKTKGDDFLMKFYITEDYKSYELLDSIRVKGDILITSIGTIYNNTSEAVGVFANFHYKTKNEKGEEIQQQYSFAMDPEYKISGWIHSVGKNKLNSMAIEVCWYEGTKLWVLSNNREKFFKSYMQLNTFEKGKNAENVFPLSEEDKGSGKSKFATTFQPPVPFNASQVSPIADKNITMYSTIVGDTRYFITEGTKYDDTRKLTEYLDLNVYRVDGKGRLTNIDFISPYRGTEPLPIKKLCKNAGAEYLMLELPIRIQLVFSPEKMEIQPITADNTYLVANLNKQLLVTKEHGTVMLKCTQIGYKYTFLWYPKS